MATPGYDYFPLTGDKLIDGMTHGYYWVLGPDRTIDFSVSNGIKGEYWSKINLINDYVKAAVNSFEVYANIKFNNLGNYATPAAANTAGSEINVTLSGDKVLFPSSNIWAMGFFNPNTSTIYAGQVGDVYLNINSQANYLPSYQPGTAGWALLIHELGHTLGLKHPHDDGGTGRPTFSQQGAQALNADWATIMSYNDSYSWNLLQFDPATPMILDVLALQYLYGKNLSTNAGNTLYNLTANNYYSTLWDASGNDTVSAKGANINWTISLPGLTLSTLIDTKTGIAAPTSDLALQSPKTLYWLAGDMENVEGGNSDDTLNGNSLDNTLIGGPGNDKLNGAEGIDSAIYTGNVNQYSLRIDRAVKSVVITDSVNNRDGSDYLINVEKLIFNNKTLDVLNLPRSEQPMYSKTNGFLFDASYYLLSHPEITGNVTLQSAFGNYISTGAALGFKPNAWFDPVYYANRWGDLKDAHLDAATLFQHYNLYGVWEGRSASAIYDSYDGARYLKENPDVAGYVNANLNAFLGSSSNGATAHYIIYGADEGRIAHQLSGDQIETAFIIGVHN